VSGPVHAGVDVATVPWPSLVIGGNGDVSVSPSAAELLGFAPGSVRDLEERIEVVTSDGVPVAEGARPWRRAARGEQFQEDERWRVRATAAQLALRVRGREVDGVAVLDLDPRLARGEYWIQQRLAELNEAIFTRASASEPVSLRNVLQRLVELAREMTGARYGALGVLDRERRKLKDFIYSGVGEEEARAIGHLPTGRGLLGAVIREARTIRVGRMADDPRSGGVPAGHPPMTSFLGVPLRLGADVFGNFYVADKQPAGEFTETDERLLERFSEQASLTVAFARQLEDEERLLLQAVVDHAPYGLVYFPADPHAEPFGNPAARRMLGRITRGDDPDRTYDLRYPDGRPVPVDQLPGLRALRDDVVINLEVVIARRDGTSLQGQISAAPVRSPGGLRLGVVAVYQDISARKELERVREDFAAIVAHDLRTPLQSVLLQIDVLLAQAIGEASTVPVSTLQTMKRSGHRLERITRELLDASRIDAGRVVLDRREVRLPELVPALVEQLQDALGTHPVTVEIAGAPPPVSADPVQIEQIVTNLLENSSKYSAEGSPIRIVLGAERGGAALTIADRGPGIAPEELPHLFDRYFQTQRAREAKRGLGLGLYITRGLVEAHGGTIAAESTPGVGSVFRIWLPAAKPAG
jgi:PAS domain S-box-containing protein